MRSLLFTSLLLLSSIVLFSNGKPDPVFESKKYYFKDVKEGTTHVFKYKFTNKGTADFVINDVRATCGCTVPEWPKAPVKPGQSGEIKVSFDTKGRVGYNAKGVNIFSNAGEINLLFEVEVIE